MMLSTPLKITLGVLLFACIAGAIRIHVVGRAEPGFVETAYCDLADATVGQLIDLSPISKQLPIDQFDYWKPQIDRILAENPQDAELHAAAALTFDTPASGWTERVGAEVAERKPDQWEIGKMFSEIMREHIRPFDQVATPLALEYAQKAVDLEPDNPQWRRLQVAISCPPLSYPEDATTRSDQLEKLVEDARLKDPDNSIYGLILAANLMGDALELNKDSANWDFEFVDRESADRAVDVTLEVIQKPFLTIGEPGFLGLNRLYSLLGHPNRGKMISIQGHSTSMRYHLSLVNIVRSLLWSGDTAETAGDTEDAIRFFKACNSTCQAISEKGGHELFFQVEFYSLREAALNSIIRLESLGDESDRARELQDVMNASLAIKTAVAAKPHHPASRTGLWFETVLVRASQNVLYGLLLGCPVLLLLTVFAGRPVFDGRPAKFGLSIGPWLVAVISLLGTAFFLGAGPAGQVSTNVQDWIALLVIMMLVAVLAYGCAVRLGKRPQFHIRTLLLACLVVAVVIQLIRVLDIGSPLNLHATPNPIIALATTANASAFSWLPWPKPITDSAMEWFVHAGPAVTVWITIAGVLVVGFVSQRLRESLHRAVASAAVFLLFTLAVWVWAYPSLLPMVKGQNDEIRQYMSDPEQYYAVVRAEYEKNLAEIQQGVQ